VPVLGRVGHQLTEVVRAVVGQKEEKGSLLVLLDELDALASPKIRRVTRFGAQLAVFDDLLVVKLLRAAIWLRGPGGEAFAGRHVRPEMPFAAQSAGVTGIAQDFAEGGEFLERVVGLRSHHEFGIEEGMHAVLRRNQPGEEGGAGR
jgi:hypothetical protein